MASDPEHVDHVGKGSERGLRFVVGWEGCHLLRSMDLGHSLYIWGDDRGRNVILSMGSGFKGQIFETGFTGSVLYV